MHVVLVPPLLSWSTMSTLSIRTSSDEGEEADAYEKRVAMKESIEGMRMRRGVGLREIRWGLIEMLSIWKLTRRSFVEKRLLSGRGVIMFGFYAERSEVGRFHPGCREPQSCEWHTLILESEGQVGDQG